MVAASSTNGRHVETPHAAVGENIASLAQEIVTLGELQAKLFWIDLQSARNLAIGPVIVLVAGACCLLGTTPVLLLALAELLNQASGWNASTAKLVIAGLSLLISLAGIWWATTSLSRASQVLSRSRDELHENLTWIKSVIRQSTTAHRK